MGDPHIPPYFSGYLLWNAIPGFLRKGTNPQYPGERYACRNQPPPPSLQASSTGKTAISSAFIGWKVALDHLGVSPATGSAEKGPATKKAYTFDW